MINREEIKTSVLYKEHRPVIRIHPNPTTDFFQITGIEDTALLTISDLHCRVLLTKKIIENERISVSVLPKGVFIAKICTSGFTIEKKIEKHL